MYETHRNNAVYDPLDGSPFAPRRRFDCTLRPERDYLMNPRTEDKLAEWDRRSFRIDR
jgi:hypothetical protein